MEYEKVNSKKTPFLLCLVVVLVLSACNNTKYLTDNQSLLIKTKVNCKEKNIAKDDLRSLLKQKDNQTSFFFIRFYMSVYNVFSKGKGSKFKKWIITHIGSEPILYDEVLAEKSRIQLLQFMNNKGYFLADVEKKVLIKHKKARLNFTITPNKPYTLKNISYKCEDTLMLEINKSHLKNSFLVPDANFNIQNLENERERITTLMKLKGYYFFEKEHVSFEADSSLQTHGINLVVSINQPIPNGEVGTDSLQTLLKHKKYYIRNTYFVLNYDYKEVLKNKATFFASLDTMKLQDKVFLLYKEKPYVNPKVLLNANYIKNEKLYNASDVEKTKLYLSQNLLFKQISFEFQEISSKNSQDTSGLLDCFVQISPSTKHSYSINLEGTNTGGDWGAQLKGTYENKNIFHGAEIFNLKLRYSFEQNNLVDSTRVNGFNSREYGVDVSIVSPKFILPFASTRSTKKYGFRTFVKVGYSFQKILYYERPIRYLSFGYISKSSKYLTQYFTPFEINGVKYNNQSFDFEKFKSQKSYYKYSYEDYYISSSSYMLFWQNKNADKIRNYSFFKFSLETAGNILYGYSKLFKRKQVDSIPYQMFNTNFAQYVKTDFDYRFNNVFGKELSTVYRLYLGVALPYGNISTIPTIKKYYAGGSTSMRAWSIRTLGPGKYKDSDTTNITYAMGDVKLEANLEQRFPIFSFLNGAVFSDIGNIWSILNTDKRAGSQISASFYKDLAIAAGFGLRPNFSFFVFRVDFAVKLRDPSLADTKQWLWAQRAFQWKGSPDYNLTIGIGYPF